MASADPTVPEELNVAAHLCRRAEEAGWGGRPAFLYGDGKVTYSEVTGRSARWAGALGELGVWREQRVLISLPDAPPFVTAFLGTIWHGAVAVPLNPYLDADRYAFHLRDTRARVAVVAPWLLEAVLAAAPEAPGLEHVVVFRDPAWQSAGRDGQPRGGRGGGPEIHDGEDLLEAAAAEEPATTHKDEPAFWLYTSGSTGPPKGAVHLHHDIVVAAERWGRRTLGPGEDAVHLSASKLFFAYGLGNSLYCPMWTGGRTVLMPERPTPGGVLTALERHRVTHFYGVPSFYGALLGDDDLEESVERGALETLRVCVSAGEALPAPVCRRWMEVTGVPLLDGIGSTEMLHIYISNRIDDLRPGASGKPVPGYEVRVVAADGGEAATDEIGDLWVKGDSCAAYYWNRHEATKEAMRGEWFVSGDKYRRDEEGYLWYAGRSDDMFKVHGLWVSPPEVEGVLLEHPEVVEAAVVRGTDRDGLARVEAFVAVDGEPEGGALADDLRRAVGEEMSSYCTPSRVHLRSELPKTPTGKIRRFRLRQELEGGEA